VHKLYEMWDEMDRWTILDFWILWMLGLIGLAATGLVVALLRWLF